MSDEEDLSAKLEGLLSEVTKVMESRKERIEAVSYTHLTLPTKA